MSSLSVFIISLLLPSHTNLPSFKNTICSPICKTEFISCVFITVVMLYSCVISWINSSITIEDLGSKPELGSSQNKYLGLFTIARSEEQTSELQSRENLV